MIELLKRAEAILRKRQQAKLSDLAQRVKALVGDAAVEIEEARLIVRGRGLVKRWMIDPQLRFLSGGLS